MKSRSLYQILDDLNRTVYLPHIQRPFVWGEDQVRKLLDSLLRNYPIQTLLFWRTKDEIKARRFMDTVRRDVDLHSMYDDAATQAGKERHFVLMVSSASRLYEPSSMGPWSQRKAKRLKPGSI